MATNDKMVELLRLALAATERGDLGWEQVGADAFDAERANGALRVDSEDGDGLRPYRFMALDHEGRVLDSRSQRFDGEGNPEDDWTDLVQSLYETARRAALNIDPVLDSLIADLTPKQTEGS